MLTSPAPLTPNGWFGLGTSTITASIIDAAKLQPTFPKSDRLLGGQGSGGSRQHRGSGRQPRLRRPAWQVVASTPSRAWVFGMSAWQALAGAGHSPR